MTDIQSKFDRTSIENQMMKALRRASLALLKAARRANLLDCEPDIKAMVPALEQESKDVMARLMRIEVMLERDLDPVTDTNEGDHQYLCDRSSRDGNNGDDGDEGRTRTTEDDGQRAAPTTEEHEEE